MPIAGQGWELLVVRRSVQARTSGAVVRRRTVGTYRVFHDGVAQAAELLSGAMAESRGPGANRPAGNGRRVEPGRYPLATQGGGKYVTHGYRAGDATRARPKPGLEVLETGERSEILVHPGVGFLASTGCLNPCTRLPGPQEDIGYARSRLRVIALIEDLRGYLGADFPRANGKPIPRAALVIEGEP